MRALLALLLCLIAAPLAAQEEIVLGLSQDRVRIDATFDGSEILVFGAIKRESPIAEVPLDVIVTLAGPNVPLKLHKKERRAGIWVNAETVNFRLAPSYYAVASSGPLDEILRQTEDLRHSITVPRAVRAMGASSAANDPQSFTEALIRIRSRNGDYQSLQGAVRLDQQTLFRTRIALPSNLTEGTYTTRVFLMREGHVVSRFDTSLDVRKVGLERWLYLLSQEKPFLYGLLSLSIAILAGWMASTLFRVIRGG